MKITLPVQLNPISRRKDKSVKLSFETRELTPTETMTLMSMESEEGHIVFSSYDDIKPDDIPNTAPELNSKSQAERIRAVLYKLYLQDTISNTYIGTWESYYKDKTEKLIEHLKSKIIN